MQYEKRKVSHSLVIRKKFAKPPLNNVLTSPFCYYLIKNANLRKQTLVDVKVAGLNRLLNIDS